MKTSEHYSPWDLLPAAEPKTELPTMDYFYENVAKHLIKDTVRVMMNGIPIDLNKVKELEITLDEILAKVQYTLDNNKLIKEFQEKQYTRLVEEYKKTQAEKMRSANYYMKPFKYNDMNHRSYVMHAYAVENNLPEPEDLLATNVPKWAAKACKKYESHMFVKKLLAGKLKDNNKFVKIGMEMLATDKAALYNKTYEDQIKDPKCELPPFNPASSKQKSELFEWLKLESEKTSKTTGLPSWDRDEIERINKETTDKDIKEFTQAMIDFSFGAIVKNNFIKAFYNYTIENRLYGTLKLFGAKSFRLTSSDPNLLNMPSTKSAYSKPVKECFVAPEGYVVYAIDYGALEDRVMASLSRDTNKCNIFLEGLDGHCLNALGYFKEEVAKEMPLTGDTNTDVKNFFEAVESGNKTLKEIRQKGKSPTFGLSYGAYPKKVASSLKISINEAQEIFNRYHNELYGGITDYRENYVLPTAQQLGKVHLGLGCYIHTDNPDADIRTLNNATCQFWSILTLLSINKLHQMIDDAGLQKDIQCISTIYDSIYFIVKKDVGTIKWLNDRIVDCMVQDFMTDQTIKNEATGEIGLNWAHMEQIPNNASIDEINKVLNSIKD